MDTALSGWMRRDEIGLHGIGRTPVLYAQMKRTATAAGLELGSLWQCGSWGQSEELVNS